MQLLLGYEYTVEMIYYHRREYCRYLVPLQWHGLCRTINVSS